jgi:hypothetical protein
MEFTAFLDYLKPPAGFYDRLIRDVPDTAWVRYLESEPRIKSAVLEGFSDRPGKLSRLVRRPEVQVRLRRVLQKEPARLEEVLELWAEENLPFVAFVEMLDELFLLENWDPVRNLLGPERFAAVLWLLGLAQREEFLERVDGSFWERKVEAETLEPVFPVLELWETLVRDYPEARAWWQRLRADAAPPSAAGGRPVAERPQQVPDERLRKLEKKLQKSRETEAGLREQVKDLRARNQDLRGRVSEWESSFRAKVEHELVKARCEWHRRYRAQDPAPLEEAENGLDAVLRRAQQAFERQREADERYGVVSAVRRRLVEVELNLREIERIEAESLMVHSDVEHVKKALLEERTKLLNRPGIDKVLRLEPDLISSGDLRRSLRLLEAVPDNLALVQKYAEAAQRLGDLGFNEQSRRLRREVEHKRRQIMETLYARFQPEVPAERPGDFSSLDDFLQSGRGRGYDIYVDGYNILLKAHPPCPGKTGQAALAAARESLVDAVCEKSHRFRKVHLVFDGVEDRRDVRGNVEIRYTDKKRGVTADAAIIWEINRSRNDKALLVTEDREIIESTSRRTFAVIDPLDFYTFIYDLPAPMETALN